MSTPAVSVLMTVFNTKAYLREAIDSILSQTVQDFELIVIDDGSTDGGWELIQELAARDARVVPLRRDVRGGASAGLNLGLARARGQLLTRQDSDDVSLPSRLAAQMAFLEGNPDVGVVGTGAVMIDPEGRPLRDFTVPETNAEIQATLLDRMCLGPHVMIRRSAFEAAGLRFDESLSGSEDYDLCLRLAEVTSIVNLREQLYLYRQHPSSVSHLQRHRQLRRKAIALENALVRRHGAAAAPDQFSLVARDYLRAGVLAHGAGESTDAAECVARAVAHDPELRRSAAALENIVRVYGTRLAPEAALTFTATLFDAVLPQHPHLARLRRALLAEIHMRGAFDARREGRGGDVARHLWPALRLDPSWLGNRAVASVIAGQIARAWPTVGAVILALVGTALLLAMTRWNVGTSPDSVQYIKAARQLVASVPAEHGEVVLVQHAPFYALLLAGGGLAGLDPLEGARWLNAAFFGLNILVVALLVRGVVGRATWLVPVAALAMFALPMLVIHGTALSEPLFVLLTLVGFWLLARHLEQPAPRLLVAAAVAIGLAFLTRYAGAAVVLAGGAALLLFGNERLPGRLRDAVTFGVVACLPILAWMLRNVGEGSSATGRELFLHPIDRSHVWQALYTVSGWALIPAGAPDLVRLALGAGLALGGAALLFRSVRRDREIPMLIRVLVLFVAVYAAFLIASISLVDANTPLDDRILLPVFVTGVIIVLYVLGRSWPMVKERRPLMYACVTAVVVFMGAHLTRGMQVAAASYESGWGFSSLEWRHSPTLSRLGEVPAGVSVYSNAPEIVYLHTGRPAKLLPRKWLPMNERPNPQYDAQLAAVSQELASGGVVVYFRHVAQTKSLPTEAELVQRLALRRLADEPDGLVLRGGELAHP